MPMPSPAAAAAAAANAVNALLARGSPSEVSHPDVFPVLLGNALDAVVVGNASDRDGVGVGVGE